jgi:hypothetical protein
MLHLFNIVLFIYVNACIIQILEKFNNFTCITKMKISIIEQPIGVIYKAKFEIVFKV